MWHSIDLFAISVLVWFSPTTNLLATTLHVCASPTLVNMGKSMALGQSLHVGCGKETTGEFVQRHRESSERVVLSWAQGGRGKEEVNGESAFREL